MADCFSTASEHYGFHYVSYETDCNLLLEPRWAANETKVIDKTAYSYIKGESLIGDWSRSLKRLFLQHTDTAFRALSSSRIAFVVGRLLWP